MWLILRLLITAAALFVATAVVPGIQLLAGTTLAKVTTLVVVALIFGVVNAVLKPIVKTVGCVFYCSCSPAGWQASCTSRSTSRASGPRSGVRSSSGSSAGC
jgi:hypothetical protein